MRRSSLGLAAVLLVCLASAVAAERPAPAIDRVLVIKHDHALRLISDGKVVKEYKVALGTAPVGRKQCEGDRRMPEGIYRLDYRSPNSQYCKSLHISYPNAADREAAAKLGVKPGGDVLIHGLPHGQEALGAAHRLNDWTWGCIAVTNEEMDEIWRLVRDGTTIEIRP